MPYVFFRPGAQKGRTSHSSPAAIFTFSLDAPRSERVLSLFLSANSLVTANAFWSTASPYGSTFSPRGVASFSSAAAVAAASPEATGFFSAVFAPFALALRNSAIVAAYSGTTSISPFSRDGSYSSRFFTVVTEVLYPASPRICAYSSASTLDSVKAAAPTTSEPFFPEPPEAAEPPLSFSRLSPPQAASELTSATMPMTAPAMREVLLMMFSVHSNRADYESYRVNRMGQAVRRRRSGDRARSSPTSTASTARASTATSSA